MRIGERVFNAQRLLNYRLKHWDREQDCFADKRCYVVAKTGIYAGHKVPWEKVLDEYYHLRG